jgi:spore coat polysaccharide biosynthesis predicted glycosyltransferase SpsG
LGHLKRCLVVARAARRRSIEVTFVCSTTADLAGDLPAREGFGQILVGPEQLTWIDDVPPGHVILLDGYSFTEEGHRASARPGVRTAAFDDFLEGTFEVDVVINPSSVVTSYDVPDASTVLSGPRYAPVSRSFVAHRRERIADVRRVLLTVGSSDPSGLAPRLLEAIRERRKGIEVVLLVGPGMDESRLRPGSGVALARREGDLAPFFDSFDAVIAAAGTTTWELLCLGLPTILVQAVENQARVVATAVEAGAALFGGNAAALEATLGGALQQIRNPAVAASLSRAALQLVDGEGAERIVGTLFSTPPEQRRNQDRL